MATFGHVAQGTAKTTGLTADRKFGLVTTAPEDGTVTEIAVDYQHDGTEVAALRAGIYNYASGTPTTLVDESDSFLISPGAARQFRLFTGLSAVVVGGASYVLALHVGPVGGQIGLWYDPGVGTELIDDDPWMDGLSASWAPVTSSGTLASPAIYAQYTPATQQAPGLAYAYVGDKWGLLVR